MKKTDFRTPLPDGLISEHDVLELLRVLSNELGPSELARRLGSTKQSVGQAIATDPALRRPVHKDIARGLGVKAWKGFEPAEGDVDTAWIDEVLEGLEPPTAKGKKPRKRKPFIEIEE